MKPLVKCQVCNAQIRQDRFDKHMRKVHSGQAQLSATKQELLTESPKPSIRQETPLVKCQICGHSVRQDRLEKHIKSKHPINYKNIQRKLLAKNVKEKRPSERSIWWIYKCNSKQLHYQNAWGDWNDFFYGDPNEQWGSTQWVPALAELKKGDMIIAYQTDRNELVGIAQVRQTCEYDTYLYLDPIEVIGEKVRPLKKSDPRIAAIPALQPGPIKTIYEISEADAKRLLKAAGSTYALGT